MLNLHKIYKISFPCLRILPIHYYSTINAGKPKPNYYKILDITEKATSAEIKAAFHKKAKEHHPDAQTNRSTTSKGSEEKFKLAVEAYKILSDETKRREYDESIKPKPSASHAAGSSAGWSQHQSSSSEGFSGSRTRYHNEKFYGDYADYQHNEGSHQQYNNAPPPPNQGGGRKRQPVWGNMDYENILIMGLFLAIGLRWTMFVWDTSDLKRTPYSEVEKLDPDDAEEEGIYIETKVPKDHSKPLSIRDCQGLRIEQLEELDRRGFILPSSVKEEVMNFRETHLVYKKQQKQTSWNFNAKYGDKPVSQPQEKAEVQPDVSQEKPIRKKKSLKEVADNVKKDIIESGKEGMPTFNKDDFAFDKPEEKTQGAGEVRIPRMRANLYNMEKHS